MMEAVAAAEVIVTVLATTDEARVLVKEWRGKVHVITVVADAVLYREQHFRSLSEVARVITGRRTDGPVFFGLDACRAQQRGQPWS